MSKFLSVVLLILMTASAVAFTNSPSNGDAIDISVMPDRLPTVSAGETILLDISPLLQANPNLHRVKWELEPKIATRKGRVRAIPDDQRNAGGTFLYWQFDVPSMPEDMEFTLKLTAYEKGKKSVSKNMAIDVLAGKGEIFPILDPVPESKEGDEITLDASKSYSTNGDIKHFIWRQTEGPYLNLDKVGDSRLTFTVPSFDNKDIGVFANDLKPQLPNPEPDDFHFPAGLLNQVDIQYLGAFAVDIDPNQDDKTSINFGKGVIAIDQANDNIWVTGNRSSVAQFKIPKQFSLSKDYLDLPRAEVVQDYFILKDKVQVGELSRHNINGMIVHDGQLLVTVEDTYDSTGSKETMQWCSNAYFLEAADCRGYYHLEGKNTSAGWMSELPNEWAQEFGYTHSLGWASNNSIDHRYSIGPSFYMFNPSIVENIDLDKEQFVPTKRVISYAMPNTINDRPTPREPVPNDPKWGSLMSVHFGVVVPNTDLFLAFGRGAGLEGGTGYKISNKDGQPSNGGDRTYLPEDTYPYFWIYNLRDAVNASQVFEPQPISFGKFPLPFAKGERSYIVGGAWHKDSGTLYLSLSDASTRKGVSRAPAILVFRLKSKDAQSKPASIERRISFDVDITDTMGYTKRTSVSAKIGAGNDSSTPPPGEPELPGVPGPIPSLPIPPGIKPVAPIVPPVAPVLPPWQPVSPIDDIDDHEYN